MPRSASANAERSHACVGVRGRDGHPNTWTPYAVAKPSVVAMPTRAPPFSNASGIIVVASMVKIAPPANDCTNATVSFDAPSSNEVSG